MLRRHPECELTITDVDPVMVAAAQRRFADAPGSPCARPMPPAAVRRRIVRHGGDLPDAHVVEWRRALGEVSRVLRPGGCFVGYDLVATPLTKGVLGQTAHRTS
ncbi:MAG: class I SAM-dependent methyltransferase [Actinomycetota bacterium]|nr:class I SAM-dependent methyltransferase [Actinomycetota bacterium]